MVMLPQDSCHCNSTYQCLLFIIVNYGSLVFPHPYERQIYQQEESLKCHTLPFADVEF